MRDKRGALRTGNVGGHRVAVSAYLLTLLAALSCGPSQSPAKTGATQNESGSVIASASDESASAATLPALTPVATPENLVAWASLPTPGKSLDTAISWAGLDVAWRPLLGALSGSLGVVLPIIDWDAPIDAAIALDQEGKNRPRFFMAASVGLTSLQEALEAFRAQEIPTQFVMPGVHSVHLTSRYECFISRAVGIAAARMVCSDSNNSLQQLHPYMTRGTKPRSTTGKALSAELLFPFAWKQFGDKAGVLQRALPLLLGEIATGDRGIDSAVRRTAGPLSAEFVAVLAELSNFHLDLQFSDAEQSLQLDLGVQLTEGSSWSSSMLASAAQFAQPAPEAFWRLPKDVSHAMYQHTGASAEQKLAVLGLRQLLEAGLTYLDASPRAQKLWLDAFEELAVLPGTRMFARGPLPPGEASANPGNRSDNSLGYWLITAEQDEPRAVGQFVKACIGLYQDPALRQSLQRQFNVNKSSLPPIVQRKGEGPLAGAQVYEFALPGRYFRNPNAEKSAKKLAAVPVQLVVGRRGQASVVGVSSSPGLLVDKLGSLLSVKATAAPSLAQRTDLQRLRKTPVNSAGFISLKALPRQLVFSSPETAQAMAQLPEPIQNLALPMLYVATKDNGQVDGSIRIELPKALIHAVGSVLKPQ